MNNLLEQLKPLTMMANLQNFLEQGGEILIVIMIVTFILWFLILERYWYFWIYHTAVIRKVVTHWDQRLDKQSWFAYQIRRQLISSVRIKSEHNLSTIQAIVAIAPLLGLLGTVTGMIEVFDVMAFTSSSNTRGMAAGISKATIPTMAGMVVSLSGLFFSTALQRRVKFEMRNIADTMTLGE